MKTPINNIDNYILEFPKAVQLKLNQIRIIVKKAAPKAEEAIKYGMPTFVLDGNLVHFAAFKQHIGFYPTPRPIEQFAKELAKYKTAKGSIQFPLDQPLPLALIKKMVEFRITENLNKKVSVHK